MTCAGFYVGECRAGGRGHGLLRMELVAGGRRRGHAEKLLVPAHLVVLGCRLCGHESVLDDYEPALNDSVGGSILTISVWG